VAVDAIYKHDFFRGTKPLNVACRVREVMFVCTFLKYDSNAAVLRCVDTNAVLRCTAKYAFENLSEGAQIVINPVRWDRADKAVLCTVGEEGPALKRARG
jgi:hypothetical protein